MTVRVRLLVVVMVTGLFVGSLAFAQGPDGQNPIDDVIDGIVEDLLGDVFGLGEEFLGLANDFSLQGLAGFICNAGRTVEEGDALAPTETPTVTDFVCDLSELFTGIKGTLDDTKTTVFSQADDIFNTFLGSGFTKVSKADQAQYTERLRRLDAAVRDGDLIAIKESGEDLLNLWVKNESRANAGNAREAEIEAIGGPGYAATKSLTTSDEYIAKKTQLNTVTNRVASEQLADELTGLTAVTGQFNSEFTKPKDGVAAVRRKQSLEAVSTRATTQVVLDAIADLQIQLSTNSQKLLEATMLEAQQTVLTNQQLSTLVEIEAQQLQVQQQSALALERLELAQNQKLASDIEGDFGFAAATFETAKNRTANEQ